MVDCPCIASVVSPVLQVAEWLAAPIWRPFKYLYNYTTNFNNLETEVDKLKSTREEVERKIIAAERNVEVICQNVKKWQDSAQEMIDKAEQLIQEKEQFIQEKANNPRCFKGLCSNFIIHYKQSRKAFKLKRDGIDRLLQKEKELSPISKPTNPPDRRFIRDEDYLTFESRNSLKKNVRDALNDENVYMIGVYGMGGLGKTTLVEELGRKAKKDKLFEDIVFVEVSESPDVKKIQTTIADKLGLKFENESEMGDKIYSRMKDKNILLILDNIWEPLELDRTVGIPRRADRGRNKLLFTTRNLDVLERMGSTNNFGMGILNEEEAWTLFTKMAGNIIPTSVHSLAKDVCKECKGLPIVICTIANALKCKGPSEWSCALQELRAPPPELTRYLEEGHTKIALSYKYLRDDELKKTFLISSLMENNTSISDLFKHVMGLDILGGVNLTMEDARNRLDTLVRNLKDACLLLDGFKNGQFAMHDVVRAVAITIAYVDHYVFTTRNDVERDWKDRDKLQKCTKISLLGDSTIISQLWPNDLNCPNLEYFNMTDMWYSSFEIPKGFFEVMPKLRVLNLVGLRQSSLPSSIGLLTNLQTLCLKDDKIEDFAIIGKLKTLKVLSLRQSNIKEFPIQLGQLTQLRLLDLSDCWRLEVIAPNVISKLSQLEEFFLKRCPIIKSKHEVLKDLEDLSNLTNLELDIKDNNVLPKDFFSKELKRYKITIGNCSYKDSIRKYQGEKLRILECNSIISLGELHGIKNLEVLCIVKPSDDEEDLDKIQMLSLFNEKVIFTNLMVLKLVNISFEKIWESQLSTFSCQNLTQMMLVKCDKIKHVFPFSIVRSLQQLQCLKIKDCKVLEKIIGEDGAEDVDFIFPQLTKLKFENLPELTIFYRRTHALEFSRLKTLKITRCPNFTLRYQSFQDNNEEGEIQDLESKSIFSGHKDIFTNLMVLELVNISFGKIWESQLSTSSYQNLTQMILVKCDKIKHVFPFSIAKSLEQLQYLMIKDCEVLEKIIEKEEGVEVVNFIFPQITELNLEDLPKLTIFCQGVDVLELPMLKTLEITRCPNFTLRYQGFQDNNEEGEIQDLESKSIFFGHKVIFTNLMILKLVNISFGKIWESQLSTSSYQNLTQLILKGCDKIKYAFPFFVAKSLQQLQCIKIVDCKVLEKIVEEKEEGEEVVNSIFPRLTKLELRNLPKLIVFYLGADALELPMLKTLEISNYSIFASIYQAFQDNNKEGESQDSESKSICLGHKVIFTNLMVLKLVNISSGKIWESQLSTSSYQNLTKLILERCDKIKYSFPFFIAKSLQQLQYLNISYCEVLEKIIEEEEEEEEGAEVVNSIFPKLIELELRYLPKLTVFYLGVDALELPMLKTLRILYCSNFTSTYQGFQDNNKEGEIQVSESKSICLEHKINSDLKVFQFYDNVRNIAWESQSKTLETSVGNLSVELLQKFYNLKVLKVSDNLSKEIKSPFDPPYLEVLDIDSCYRLTSLPTFSTYFLNLQVLRLSYCHRLIRRLITSSMAKSLVHLREMSIYRCNLLTEVVEDEADATTTNISFHNLRKLSLKELDSLTCFCSGNYSFNFPSLEELIIEECLNMKTFCLGFLNTPRLQNVNYENELVEIGENDLNTSIQQAHKNRVNSDLSKLSLSGRDIMSILQEEFKKNFDKVETLELIKDEYTHIPIHILVKFINLENLIFKVSSYEEIFSYEEDEEHVGALAKLKKLKLQGLFNLKCIWKQDFWFKTILQNLHSLEVRYCDNLMTLLPPLSSFENLWSLEVAGCIGMQNLMTSSTAKSLVSLERLSILGCKMMIEVLANDEDIEKDEIVFEKLKELLLFDLESLTSFGSGKYNLKFPSLESLSVNQCSKMKTFFEGGLNMPKLRLVNEKDYLNNLNWVTQQLQNDCSKLWEESAKSYDQGAGEGESIFYHCNYCYKDITGRIRMRCAICPYFDLCVECFSVGAEVTPHKSNHPYKVHESKSRSPRIKFKQKVLSLPPELSE